MAAVAAFLHALPSGPCGLVLEGAAGIGKTTVWRAGAAWSSLSSVGPPPVTKVSQVLATFMMTGSRSSSTCPPSSDR
jgi:hypothetical protein